MGGRDPRRYDDYIRDWWWPCRYLCLARRSIAAVAGDAGAAVSHPLAEGPFLSALATETGWKGFASRTDAMTRLFGDVLPPDVPDRRDKATFASAFFHRHSRTFVQDWSGEGVPESVVDVDRLRELWSEPDPDARSFLLLQNAWLSSAASGLESGGPKQR